jgi:hypothetical protein
LIGSNFRQANAVVATGKHAALGVAVVVPCDRCVVAPFEDCNAIDCVMRLAQKGRRVSRNRLDATQLTPYRDRRAADLLELSNASPSRPRFNTSARLNRIVADQVFLKSKSVDVFATYFAI